MFYVAVSATCAQRLKIDKPCCALSFTTQANQRNAKAHAIER